MKLEGRVAVITGGGYGIGAAIRRLFAREGARVALVDSDGTRGEETARKIRKAAETAGFTSRTCPRRTRSPGLRRGF